MKAFQIPNDYFDFSAESLISGSKFCGIRSIDRSKLLNNFIEDLTRDINDGLADVKNYSIAGLDHYFIVKKLPWDTEFFKRPMYRVLAVLYCHDDYSILVKAVKLFSDAFVQETERNAYCYMEVPSESNILIQSLTANKFRLVETRLHHYLKNIQNFNYKRFDVREATEDDTDRLSSIAAGTRNRYDRFHSDVYFTDELADEYLGRFAKETIKGLADRVIVPNEIDVVPNALFAVNLLVNDWKTIGAKVSQLVLAVVDPNTCKGWYEKLLSEVCYYLKENGSEYLITNTQTTNKAPIHVNEKLGFKYSHTTHILTLSNL